MNKENLVAFYELDLARYGPDDARSLHWVSARTQGVRFKVLYQAGPWEGVSVADVGCGLGDFAGFLASQGHRVHPGPGPTPRPGLTAEGAERKRIKNSAVPASSAVNQEKRINNSAVSASSAVNQGKRIKNSAVSASSAVNQEGGAVVWYNGYDLAPGMVQAARRKYPQGSFHLRDVLAEGFIGAPDYVIASGTFNIRIEDHDRWLREMIAAMYAACRRAVAFNFLALPQKFTAESAEDAESKRRVNSAVGVYPEPAERASSAVNKGGWEGLARWNTIYYETDPQELLAYCQTLSPRTVLRDGYLPGDCTVYLYRD